jgi:hypothetical protein
MVRGKRRMGFDPTAYALGGMVIGTLIVVLIIHTLLLQPYFQSYEQLLWYRRFLYFDYMFILFFSLTLLCGGFLIAFMGAGKKNKLIGGGFMIFGTLFITGGLYYFDKIFIRPKGIPSNVYEALVAVLSSTIALFTVIGIVFLLIWLMRQSVRRH